MKIFTVTAGVCAANCYLVCEGKSAVAIDPTDDARRVIDFAHELGVTIERVLITHGHYDHCGGTHLLDGACGVYMSRRDYDDLDELNDMFGIPVKNFDVWRFVSDGDGIEFCGHMFKVIATPGHTTGGVCYLLDGAYLFSGDTLFRRSVGRTDFVGGDMNALMRSLQKLLALDGSITVYPGHGERTTLAEEKENNPYVRAYRG